jgi:ribosomal protein S18 acetylase RimI-like enzyme
VTTGGGTGRPAVDGAAARLRGRPPQRYAAPDAAIPIRQATLDDLDTVVALRLALLREHRNNPIAGRLRADAADRARLLFAAQLTSDAEIVFLAERRGEPVGIIRCVETIGSPLLEPARYGYLSSAYVVPPARRTGVLRALLARAEAWCAGRGLTEIRLHNAADHAESSAVWQALGFEVVEQLRRRVLPPR